MRLLAAVLSVTLWFSTHASSQAATELSWRCLQPATVSCFTHRGRLSSQNGVPHMLWLIGTTRVLAITETEMPAMLSPYLDMTSPRHSDVFGDFEICPLEPERAAGMRSACIKAGTKLVVQDR